MRFEEFERRIVFDQSLGPAIELNIDTVAPVAVPDPPSPLPSNIRFRNTADDFEYSSQDLSPELLDKLISTTEQWNDTPTSVHIQALDRTDFFRNGPGHYPPRINEDGVIVAQRFVRNTNKHTMMSVGVENSRCYHTGDLYTQQDYHYHFSFDVRHPRSELSWLNDHGWGLVMQLWGPREPNETPRTPPFAIFSKAIDGKPYWTVMNYGDSRLTTNSGDREETHKAQVPMTNIGEWNRFDVEFVPNPFGQGLVRTWLNGQLIAEWKDIKNIYYSMFSGKPSGPLAPSFGLYSSMDEDGMEVHIDNISVQCNGPFQSSIAGTVSGTSRVDGTVVFATNQVTGESFGSYAGSSGVYTLAVPKGLYAVTAVDQETGQQTVVENVSTVATSRLVNLEMTHTAPPPPQAITLTGDVTGDGKSEIINRLADGSWQVSVANDEGTYDTSIWSQWSTNVNWSEIRLADFTGDGKQDIIGRVADGNWWVAESTGSGFRNRHWGQWSSNVTWKDVSVGDFNGDGRSDLAGREAATGTWWVSMSNGSRLSTYSWGRWSAAVEWVDTVVADFNGDGKSDIAGRVAGDGNWWVAVSNGWRFQNRHWGQWSKAVTWDEVRAGDFNGDGLTDIVGRSDDGKWWVAQSTGSKFQNAHWGSWSTNVSWSDITVADVDGDGQSDIVGRVAADGHWWIARSNGDRFLNQFWGAIWSADEDWLAVHINDFDGDGKADLLGASAAAWLLTV